MSKYCCQCGWTISDVAWPNPDKHHVISDEDLDAVTDYGTEPSTIVARVFRERKRALLVCPQCGRLHVQDEPGVNHYTTYAKDVDREDRLVQLEAALAQMLHTYSTDPGYHEYRKRAEKVLKREE